MCWYRVVKETRQTVTEQRLQGAEDMVAQHKKNHIYWSATSSVSGPENLAKWTSLLNHIQNVHVHENPVP